MKPVDDNSGGKYNLFLYFSAIAANLATFSAGCIFVWSSSAIPRLNGLIRPETNPLKESITPSQESWIASLVPLGAAVSAFISGYLADVIGRKKTLIVSSVPSIVGFTFLVFGCQLLHFYIGRFLCGLTVGTAMTIIPIYIGEIAESSNRGTLGCFLTFFLSTGNMYVYLLTPNMTLQMLSIACLVIPVIFFILFGLFVPESPYFYVKTNRIDLAEKALLKFRLNNTKIVRNELPIIIADIRESLSKKIRFKSMLSDKSLKRGLVISLGLMCFQQFSGVNAVFFYMQSIFEEIGSGISSNTCVIIAGIVQLAASACTLPTVDRFGRRILLLTSAVGNVLTHLVNGIYFYLRENTTVDVTSFNWLPVVTINLFILTYTLGFGPVSFTMIGELFPLHVKGFAATLNVFVCLTSVFMVTNIFPYMKELLGFGLTFVLFALISCVSGVFVYCKVPETKGKRLEEIQGLLLENKLNA
ncbi:hypothetical protein Trydic_g11774 [Trypoxylus dichotomus]